MSGKSSMESAFLRLVIKSHYSRKDIGTKGGLVIVLIPHSVDLDMSDTKLTLSLIQKFSQPPFTPSSSFTSSVGGSTWDYN